MPETNNISPAKLKVDRSVACPRCLRPVESCFCARVTTLDNRVRIVILQHPQERYKAMNSARLSHLTLGNSRILVGLSWPNFRKVAGNEEQPSQWGVLALNPVKGEKGKPISIVNRRKEPLEDPAMLRGIIALDGSWKQAKTLWWRNPWLLRLNRISLNPAHPSLRPQAKSEGLSTIEAIAGVLEHLGEEGISTALRENYGRLIIGTAEE